MLIIRTTETETRLPPECLNSQTPTSLIFHPKDSDRSRDLLTTTRSSETGAVKVRSLLSRAQDGDLDI